MKSFMILAVATGLGALGFATALNGHERPENWQAEYRHAAPASYCYETEELLRQLNRCNPYYRMPEYEILGLPEDNLPVLICFGHPLPKIECAHY